MVKLSSEEVVAVKRFGLLASLVTVVVFLAVPTSAIAGWAGSRYEKSECTHVDLDGRPGLYCETFFMGPNEVFEYQASVPDASCPSGFRLMRVVDTYEVTVFAFDFYDAPVPLFQFNRLGNESPSLRLISTVEIDLGCAP